MGLHLRPRRLDHVVEFPGLRFLRQLAVDLTRIGIKFGWIPGSTRTDLLWNGFIRHTMDRFKKFLNRMAVAGA